MTPLRFVDNHLANPRLTPVAGVQFASACGRWKIVASSLAAGPREWLLYEHDPPLLPGTVGISRTTRRAKFLVFTSPQQAAVVAQVLHAMPLTRGDVLAAARLLRTWAVDRARTALVEAGARAVDVAHGVAAWLRESATVRPPDGKDDPLMRD